MKRPTIPQCASSAIQLGAPAVGLKQPPRHRDFAPKGQPLLVSPLLEANHGLGRRLAGLGQLQKSRPPDLVQRCAQTGDRLSKRGRVLLLLQLNFQLTDIFTKFATQTEKSFVFFTWDLLPGWGLTCKPQYTFVLGIGVPFLSVPA